MFYSQLDGRAWLIKSIVLCCVREVSHGQLISWNFRIQRDNYAHIPIIIAKWRRDKIINGREIRRDIYVKSSLPLFKTF